MIPVVLFGAQIIVCKSWGRQTAPSWRITKSILSGFIFVRPSSRLKTERVNTNEQNHTTQKNELINLMLKWYQATIKKYAEKAPQLSERMGNNIPVGLTIFALTKDVRKILRTFNMCENHNRQINRRTRVVGLLPNNPSLPT